MALDHDAVLNVEVVSADRMVWEGEASSVIVRTTEGDIGILVNHVPLLAALVPSAAEILTSDGKREIVAVDGGFVSVDENRVAVLSQYARLADEIDLNQAEHEFNQAHRAREEGDDSEETARHLHRAEAQLRAAQRLNGLH